MAQRWILAVLLMGSIAHADDKPDPLAQRVGEEANLDPVEYRRGLTASAALGPAITVGGGGTGAGGAVNLAFGTVAGPRSIFWIEFGGSAAAHKVMGEVELNQYTHALIAGQFYLQPALYMRIGAGWGSYACKKCRDPDDDANIMPVDYTRRGPASELAFGVEIVHFHMFALSFEGGGISTLTKQGLIVGLRSGLVLSID
jgi:hypothetical protein